LELPYITRLGASNRRLLDHNPEMRSQTEPPRMSDAVPVQHYSVRRCLQPAPGPQQQRRLPERQQSRDIRKSDLAYFGCIVHQFELRQAQHDNADIGSSRTLVVSDVTPGDQARRPSQRLYLYPFPKLLL